MADLSKFEQMLERLINEDREGAQELFHDIVVEKSRNIYESLLESDEEEDEDEEVDEASDEDDKEDEDEECNEDFSLDEFEVEAEPAIGGDATDDLIGDLSADDEGDDEGEFNMDLDGAEGEEEGDVEDRVVDLEDALDELKAEFEKMLSGDEGEEDFGDDEGEEDFGDDEGEEDFDDEGEEESEEEDFNFESNSKKTSGEQMREYVEKVAGGHGAEKKGSGDNGQNTKSAVAGPNKMGNGTSQNIARGDEYKGGNHSGLGDLNAKDQDAGNINKPGGKASKAQSNVAKGHGAEKKGSGETGQNAKPIIGSSKKK